VQHPLPSARCAACSLATTQVRQWRGVVGAACTLATLVMLVCAGALFAGHCRAPLLRIVLRPPLPALPRARKQVRRASAFAL
jgi:hypothetical protein